MKTKLCVLAVVALIAFAVKRHYADATADALSWILAPTAWLVGHVTGTTFTAVPGEGYLSRERLFLIEKACAGINFLIAAFGMLTFALLHRVTSAGAGAAVLGVSLLASYSAAVIINTARIVIAMWLASHPLTLGSLSADDIHRIEGIIVYFGGLLLLYELVQRVDRGTVRIRYLAVPLAAYYGITLVVPIVNGALRPHSAQAAGEAFLEHVLMVLIVPAVFIALASMCVIASRHIRTLACAKVVEDRNVPSLQSRRSSGGSASAA